MGLHILKLVEVKVEMLSFNPMKNYNRFTKIFQQNIFKDRREQDIKEQLQDEHFND